MLLACTTAFADVMVLFDEDEKTEAGAGDFAALFTSHDAGSTVTVTNDEAYDGKVSAFVTPAQSYNSNMTGWNFPIVEKPGKGEYRYIQFAWKSDGGTGVMIQFPDNGNWGSVTVPCFEDDPNATPANPIAPGTRRYIFGKNVTGWSGICLSDKIPEKWTVVTRDLVKDFGEFTMTGIALTPFSDGGKGDYYDAIVIASSEDELPSKKAAVNAQDKLATTWAELKTY